jgi:hypothetical protein
MAARPGGFPAHREGITLPRRSGILGLWAVGVLAVATACGGNQAPASEAAAASPASSVAVAASPSPSPSASATPSPTPTASPTPTPVPTPVPWQTYASKRFKYRLSYPPEWVVTPGTSKRADQYDDYSSHFVYVSRDTVSTTVDLAGTVADEKALLKSHYKAKLLTDKKISLGSYSGRLLTLSGVSDGRKLYMQIIIVKRSAVAYFIEMFSDTGTEADDRKLFYRMYKTFKATS